MMMTSKKIPKLLTISDRVKHKGLGKTYLQCCFFRIQLCLLFVVGDFLLFVVFQKEICDGKMLVLFHVFIGLCFTGWNFSLYGCALIVKCNLWCEDYQDVARRM
jgi:hypothetical protein